MRVRHLDTPLATVEAYTVPGGDDPIGSISFPVRDFMNAATVSSLMGTDWSFLGNRRLDRTIIQGSILPLQRNEAVQRMRGDWLLFIDDDMTWEPDMIGRLVESYYEIKEEATEPFMLGGLCVRRTPPHQPTMYAREHPTSGMYNFMEDWGPEAEVIEVDATGMAFIMIGRDVFEAIMGGPMPDREDRLKLPPWEFFYWRGSMGEDLRFCADAKEKGVRIYVDTRVRPGHIGERAFTIEDFWSQVATRGKVVEDLRRSQNDRMGLPTLTEEEARRRLGW